MHDTSLAPLLEAEVAQPRARRGGACLICGEWVDAGDPDAFTVVLDRHEGEIGEYAAHAVCLAQVAHPGVRLPARHEPIPENAPANYLDHKPFTPEGR